VRVIFGSLGPQPQTQVPMVSVEMQLMGWWWADGYEMPGGWWKVSSAWCWNLEDFLCATAKGEKTQQMVFFFAKKVWELQGILYHSWRGHLVMVPTLNSPQTKVLLWAHPNMMTMTWQDVNSKVPRYQGTGTLPSEHSEQHGL
jgi:hypothetical protein